MPQSQCVQAGSQSECEYHATCTAGHAAPVIRPTLGGDRPFCSRCGRPLFTMGLPPWLPTTTDRG
jgi:hypothetical protein